MSHFLSSNFGLQYQCKEPGADLTTIPDYYDNDEETEILIGVIMRGIQITKLTAEFDDDLSTKKMI